MLVETFFIFLIALLANSQDFLGTSFIGRPIVTSVLIGLVFGDPIQGLQIGAVLELAFLGLMGVGATVPPDEIVGGILTTALIMKNNYDIDVALTLVFPIATLGLAIKNILYVFIFPMMTHRADEYAEMGKIDQAGNMHLIASFTRIITMSLVIALSYHFGNSFVDQFLNIIPQVFIDGMAIMTGLLPAVGFAMLLNMTFSVNTAPYFFIGFVLASYLKLDTVAISIIGASIASIIYFIYSKIDEKQSIVNTEEDEFDDF